MYIYIYIYLSLATLILSVVYSGDFLPVYPKLWTSSFFLPFFFLPLRVCGCNNMWRCKEDFRSAKSSDLEAEALHRLGSPSRSPDLILKKGVNGDAAGKKPTDMETRSLLLCLHFFSKKPWNEMLPIVSSSLFCSVEYPHSWTRIHKPSAQIPFFRSVISLLFWIMEWSAATRSSRN